MKLIIQNNRIAGTATDEYTGPDEFIAAPDDFDPARVEEYVIAEGVAALPQADVRREIMDGVQRYLDDFARTKTYDSILSACTYATSLVPKFAAEGQYCVSARDTCWGVVAQIEAEVLAGTRPVPAGFEEIKPELPALAWPQ